MALRSVKNEKLDHILRLYRQEPPPVKAGSNAGLRKEGMQFASEMREALRPIDPNNKIVIETVLAKSSNKDRLDGNASERISFKMLRFKRNPFMQDHLLVIAMNHAFETYENLQISEIREQASWLNAIDSRAQIMVLSKEHHYREYFATVFV
jgi:hypothetical protein